MQIFHRVSQTRSRRKIKIALEAGLYSQVVMIQSQTVVDKDKDSSTGHKIKYSFQGKSTRSQHWFKLDPEWIYNFSQRILSSSKVSIKNIYHYKLINIGLHFLFQ